MPNAGMSGQGVRNGARLSCIVASMMTRTHTVYWDEKSIAPLLEEIKKLRTDLDSRRRFIDVGAAAAMNSRLVILEHAAGLLTDWAD